MKKISWKKAKGGRAMEHQLEGHVDGKLAFIVNGRHSITDLIESKKSLKTDVYIHPKNYRLNRDGQTTDFRSEATTIASDLLNGLNLEFHQANWQKGEDEAADTIKVIGEAQAFLDSLKRK
jgi:type IV secretory pathway VirD2 relaxase|tara:strand:- start:40270 stop:40632 length:363 start_codon:yes stop_codon:yes gene_type:complete